MNYAQAGTVAGSTHSNEMSSIERVRLVGYSLSDGGCREEQIPLERKGGALGDHADFELSVVGAGLV